MITDILRSISIIFFHYTQFTRKLQYKGNGPKSSRLPHIFTGPIFLLTTHSPDGILTVIQEVLFMCQTISLQKMNRDDDR